MKLYPGTHGIYSVEKTDSSEEVILGYVDSEYLEESIEINVSDDFNSSYSKELLPYNTINDLEMTFYTRNGVALAKDVQEEMITRESGNSYIYTPNNSITFEPYKFTYKVLAKKNMSYMSSRKYNIKAVCSDRSLADILIHFFADSYERNLCPTNVKFNSGDKKIDSLFEAEYEDSDFIFINSSDGETFISNDNEIPIDEYLDNNIVPWIFCDKLPGTTEINNVTSKTFELQNEIMSNVSSYTTDKYFKIPVAATGEEYHTLFKYELNITPILIKEYVNKGFVVYCHNDFLTNINSTYGLFYEVLMYVYLNTYLTTDSISEWIADEMPDYIVQNGRLTQKDKFTSHMELHKLLGLMEGDVSPVEVKITPQDGNENVVYYTGMSSNYLVFKKMTTTDYADPIKDKNQISIFTERKNIIFYDDFIYNVQDDITDYISIKISDNTLIAKVKPFKSTVLDTYNFISTITCTYELDEDLLSQEVLLIWNKNRKTIELVSELEDNLILLANIKITKEEKESNLYDMRVRGGGLPEDSEDNNDCLDIANVLGRPYRKGGAIITTVSLPKKYEEQKDVIYKIIYEEMSKHIIAEDYLILNLEFN